MVINVEKPDKYWARPAEAVKGDNDLAILYQSVGQALTYWEFVEEAFSTLFAALIESPSIAASRAYGSIASARGRSDVLREAANTFFLHYEVSQESRVDFEVLMQHFSQASARRNEIAHGMAIHFFPVGRDNGYFLTSPSYNSNKTSLGIRQPPSEIVETDRRIFVQAKYRYTSDQINKYAGKFSILHQMAQAFRKLHIVDFLEARKAETMKPVEQLVPEQ